MDDLYFFEQFSDGYARGVDYINGSVLRLLKATFTAILDLLIVSCKQFNCSSHLRMYI